MLRIMTMADYGGSSESPVDVVSSTPILGVELSQDNSFQFHLRISCALGVHHKNNGVYKNGYMYFYELK